MNQESDRSAEIKKTFHENARQYLEIFGGQSQSQPPPPIQLVASKLPPSHAHVLDLGCGPGNMSKALHKLLPEAHFTLVDFAPDMCDLAREQLPQAHVIECDVRQIQQHELPSFHGVICGFCIPYLSPNEVETLLSYISVHAQPGGVLLLSYIESSPLNSRYIKPSSGDGKGIYTHFYERDHLVQLLSNSGFTLLQTFESAIENSNSYDPAIHSDVTIIAQKNAP